MTPTNDTIMFPATTTTETLSEPNGGGIYLPLLQVHHHHYPSLATSRVLTRSSPPPNVGQEQELEQEQQQRPSYHQNWHDLPAQQQQQQQPPLRQRSMSSTSSQSCGGGGTGWFPINSPPTSPPATPLRQQQLINVTDGAGDGDVSTSSSSSCSSISRWAATMTTPRNQLSSQQNKNNKNNTHFSNTTHNHSTPRTCNGKRRSSSASTHMTTIDAGVPLHSIFGGEHDGAVNHFRLEPASSSSSSFDCQFLQHSLKRVRLSSSPGELRLQSDLKYLVLEGGWRQVQDDEWECSAQHCRLERMDPLRLLFTWRDDNNHSHHAKNNNTTNSGGEDNHPHPLHTTSTASLQFPKMYPHRPPIVSQIYQRREQQRRQEHQEQQLQFPFQYSLQHQPHSGNNQPQLQFNHFFSPPPHVAADPNRSHNHNCTENPNTTTNHSKTISLAEGWSPIMRLSDILDFLRHGAAGDGSDEKRGGGQGRLLTIGPEA